MLLFGPATFIDAQLMHITVLNKMLHLASFQLVLAGFKLVLACLVGFIMLV